MAASPVTERRLRLEDFGNTGRRPEAICYLDDMVTLLESSIAVARGTPATGLREPIDLRALIAGEIAERNSARVQLIAPGFRPEILGSELVLRRSVANLINNADRYAVRCRVAIIRSDDDAIIINFYDDGPGNPAAERAAVLEPF